MTNLERAVLKKFLDGEHPILSSLRHQLDVCTVGTRELTGFGFYTNLIVDTKAVEYGLIDERSFVIADVVAQQVSGLQHGACFVLYVENGALKMLEGASYDEPWPEQISDFELMYMSAKSKDGISSERDWLTLIKILDVVPPDRPLCPERIRHIK